MPARTDVRMSRAKSARWSDVIEDTRFLRSAGVTAEQIHARLVEAGTFHGSEQSFKDGLRRRDRDLSDWVLGIEEPMLTEEQMSRIMDYEIKMDNIYKTRFN